MTILLLFSAAFAACKRQLLVPVLLLAVLLPASSAASCLDSTREQLLQKAQQYDAAILQAARRYQVDANLIRAVIAIESCYNHKAVSPAGARGLMQVIPATGERFGAKDLDDPDVNIDVGTRYLRFLQQLFKGDKQGLQKVLAAYNAGEGAVQRYQGIPPYQETRHYVKNVVQTYKKLIGKQAVAARKQPSSPARPRVDRIKGKPGRQGLLALKLKAPHLFKQGGATLQQLAENP